MGCSNYITVIELGVARAARPTDPIYFYNPKDFGADHLTVILDWHHSGYDHYIATAYKSGGGSVSWNEAEEADSSRSVANIHMTDKANRYDKPGTVWTEDSD
jgi:hypothetical protein